MQNDKTPSDKKGLLDRWLRQKKEQKKPAGIQKMPADRTPPLSLGQQRLWFLQQLYPGNPFYHYADILRLDGELQIELLWESFRLLAQKHAILRTTFPAKDGTPYQLVGPVAQIDFSINDIRETIASERELTAKNLAMESAGQAFDLVKGPLTRIRLIQLEENQYWLVLTMHHIITDKWSMGILREEVASYYRNLTDNTPVTIQELPIQYVDYAYWQKNQDIDKLHLAYWQKKLTGELPVLKLPADYPRPVHPSFRGAFCTRRYDENLSARLKALSQKANTTLFVLLLTAYKVLLHRYSGQEDILVGTPFTNRDQTVLEPLIGFFNDTLVLRSDLSGNPSFLELIQQMRQTVLDAFSHKNTPFETLVRVLSPDRQMSANPLFQVMFLYHKVPPHPSFGPDLRLAHEPFDLGVSKFDLTLYLSEEEKHLSATFEYTSDLFEQATIQRMQDHLQILLEGVVAQPDQAISTLPILPESEIQQLLVEWNNNQKPLPQHLQIHQLFDRLAEQHPDRTGVVFKNKQLTYKNISEQSDAVASYLLSRGAGRGSIVGLYSERSPDMIIGIFGILKAGAAYLPLDPEYPEERIRFMLEDAGVMIVLCQDQLAETFPVQSIDLLSLGASSLHLDKPLMKASIVTNEDDLAYVIYTSGSTGKPKGVLVSHENLMHSTAARFDYYPHQPNCFLLLSSFAFDSSVVGIFWTLSTGGTLLLPERRIEQDLDRLSQLIIDHQVSHTLLLPSLYSVLLQHIQREDLQSLNTVIVAGEACSAHLVREHFAVLPEATLYNEYGPTEASVWCTVHKVKPEDARGTVPIGRPIANAEIYLLDKQLQPVPIGVVGELYVGGLGVTGGYLNRPELTARHFIKNPFKEKPSDNLYKTGDLARYRPNGLIEFLGRADQQVKIRGYRIELEEIRENLLAFAGVQDALVVVQEDQDSRPRLLAYVVGGSDVETNAVIRQLKEKLPAYMVPASLMLLAEWPRLPNRKINQAALPVTQENIAATDGSYSAPSSPLEHQLVRIWEEVLNVRPVSVQDNFFEIGGDSILSIQIIAKARKAGLKLSANQLFDHQTIAELALFMPKAEEISEQRTGLLIGLVPLAPIQEWFFAEHRLAPHHWNQGIVFELRQPVPEGLMQQAIDYIVLQHDALRLRFQLEDNEWQAFILEPEKIFPFQYINLGALDKLLQEETIREKSAATQSSFVLSKGSLFQAIYFDCGSLQNDRLLLVAHHLLVDAVSWKIIFDDLKTIMQQLMESHPINLPPRTTPYSEWVSYLAKTVSKGQWEETYAYWLEQIKDPVVLLVDQPGDLPVAEASIETLSWTLDQATTTILLKEVPRAYSTKTDEVLITALMEVLEGWTGSSTVNIGLERHGRETVGDSMDLSATVGWFTAFFPVRLNFESQKGIGENLKTIKEQLRKVPQGGIGYGVLRYLATDPSIKEGLNYQPSLLFNFLGQQDLLSSEWLGEGQMVYSGARDSRSERNYMMEINAFILENQLMVRWSYSRDLHEEQTVKGLLDSFESAIRRMIDHCTTLEAGEYTPSDFPEADLSQDDLDQLLDQLNF